MSRAGDVPLILRPQWCKLPKSVVSPRSASQTLTDRPHSAAPVRHALLNTTPDRHDYGTRPPETAWCHRVAFSARCRAGLAPPSRKLGMQITEYIVTQRRTYIVCIRILYATRSRTSTLSGLYWSYRAPFGLIFAPMDSHLNFKSIHMQYG